ncbi:hypothetical protein GYA19_05005 [Candidatus Beckwithbacteria bacterium]|nr:hypothetical protein [Candidatus Beckwithbacteria bacterium]
MKNQKINFFSFFSSIFSDLFRFLRHDFKLIFRIKAFKISILIWLGGIIVLLILVNGLVFNKNERLGEIFCMGGPSCAGVGEQTKDGNEADPNQGRSGENGNSAYNDNYKKGKVEICSGGCNENNPSGGSGGGNKSKPKTFTEIAADGITGPEAAEWLQTKEGQKWAEAYANQSRGCNGDKTCADKVKAELAVDPNNLVGTLQEKKAGEDFAANNNGKAPTQADWVKRYWSGGWDFEKKEGSKTLAQGDCAAGTVCDPNNFQDTLIKEIVEGTSQLKYQADANLTTLPALVQQAWKNKITKAILSGGTVFALPLTESADCKQGTDCVYFVKYKTAGIEIVSDELDSIDKLNNWVNDRGLAMTGDWGQAGSQGAGAEAANGGTGTGNAQDQKVSFQTTDSVEYNLVKDGNRYILYAKNDKLAGTNLSSSYIAGVYTGKDELIKGLTNLNIDYNKLSKDIQEEVSKGIYGKDIGYEEYLAQVLLDKVNQSVVPIAAQTGGSVADEQRTKDINLTLSSGEKLKIDKDGNVYLTPLVSGPVESRQITDKEQLIKIFSDEKLDYSKLPESIQENIARIKGSTPDYGKFIAENIIYELELVNIETIYGQGLVNGQKVDSKIEVTKKGDEVFFTKEFKEYKIDGDTYTLETIYNDGQEKPSYVKLNNSQGEIIAQYGKRNDYPGQTYDTGEYNDLKLTNMPQNEKQLSKIGLLQQTEYLKKLEEVKANLKEQPSQYVEDPVQLAWYQKLGIYHTYNRMMDLVKALLKIDQ